MREPFFVWRWTKLIIVGEVSETLNNFKKKVKQSFQNPSLLVDCKWMFRDVCNLIIKTHRNYVWIYQHRSESKWVALRQLIVLKSFRFDWSTKVAMLIGRLSVKPWCHCLWFGSQPSAVIACVLNKNAVSWQIRNNRQLPKHKVGQNAKNLQCLLKFGLIEDNVTVFQWPWNSESG